MALPLVSAAAGQSVENAKRAFDAGRYEEAARLFEQVHRATGRCDVRFFLGIARYRLGQVDAALVAFQAAGACDPKLAAAHLALAEAYLERGNEAGALTAFEKVLRVAPGNVDALHGAASLYLRGERNAQAIPLLERLVAAAPGNARARTDLAAALAVSGRRAEAVRHYEQVLRVNPADASALVGLANLRLKEANGNPLELLLRAVKAAPGAHEPRVLLGMAYNRLGRFDDAIRALGEAVALGGEGSAEVHYHLARAYGGAGRGEERRRELARFAELTGEARASAEARRQAQRCSEEAAALVKAGDLAGAVVKMEEARQLQPGDAGVLFRLGGLQLDLGRLEEASSYAQEAVSLAPTAWEHHYLLGLAGQRLGRLAEAEAAFAVAVSLDSKAADARRALDEVRRARSRPGSR